MIDTEFWKLALSQGGAVAVALILMWFYRRDWSRIISKDEEKIQILMGIVTDCAKAIEASVAQSEATEKAVTRLARAMEEGGRRSYDPVRREESNVERREERRSRARPGLRERPEPNEHDSVRAETERNPLRQG
jgi:hypothetical protein